MSTEIQQDFQGFLESVNLTQTMITLLISSAVNGLIGELLDQFLTPITKQYLTPKGKRLTFLNTEINLSRIINKILALILTILFAFGIYRYLK